MSTICVSISYPGSVITVNHCYHPSHHLKAEAEEWRRTLGWAIKAAIREVAWELTPPLKIVVSGQFKDRRSTPDLHNLKLVADAVQMATGLNDRDYNITFEEPVVVKGCDPTIYVEISDANEEGDATNA